MVYQTGIWKCTELSLCEEEVKDENTLWQEGSETWVGTEWAFNQQSGSNTELLPDRHQTKLKGQAFYHLYVIIYLSSFPVLECRERAKTNIILGPMHELQLEDKQNIVNYCLDCLVSRGKSLHFWPADTVHHFHMSHRVLQKCNKEYRTEESTFCLGALFPGC